MSIETIALVIVICVDMLDTLGMCVCLFVCMETDEHSCICSVGWLLVWSSAFVGLPNDGVGDGNINGNGHTASLLQMHWHFCSFHAILRSTNLLYISAMYICYQTFCWVCFFCFLFLNFVFFLEIIVGISMLMRNNGKPTSHPIFCCHYFRYPNHPCHLFVVRHSNSMWTLWHQCHRHHHSLCCLHFWKPRSNYRHPLMNWRCCCCRCHHFHHHR